MAEEKKNNNNASTEKTDLDYWNTMNPETGRRYDIPMLDKRSGDYVFKYVEFMKTREKNPETFERMLNWD